MNDRDSAYAQDITKRMEAMSDYQGIDPERTSEIVAQAVELLHNVVKKTQSTAIESERSVTCRKCQAIQTVVFFDLDKQTKAAMQISKTADILVRLTAFTQGKEDSRPGGPSISGNTFYAAFTPEQIQIMQGWLRENQAVQQG